jgi:hypothetical protein
VVEMALRLLARFASILVVLWFCVCVAFAQDAMPLEGLSFAKKMKLAKAGDDTAQLAVAISFGGRCRH